MIGSNRIVPLTRPHGKMPSALDLSTGWEVTFGKSGRSVVMDQLRSWTDDEKTRFFSGIVTYGKTFTLPENFSESGLENTLDFGEGRPIPETPLKNPGMQAWLDSPVREAAVVYVNGQRAGSVWHPPYSVVVAGLLKAGKNTLRVVLGNLSINEMAGSALPDNWLLNSRYGARATPQDVENLQALPSGLLGPVRLFTHVAQKAMSDGTIRKLK